MLIEVLLLTLILGSLLYAALRLWHDVRSTRALVAQLKLSDVLLSADTKIDGPVRECLADGSIRLPSSACHPMLSTAVAPLSLPLSLPRSSRP